MVYTLLSLHPSMHTVTRVMGSLGTLRQSCSPAKLAAIASTAEREAVCDISARTCCDVFVSAAAALF
jgi:hypothetical protein